MSNGNPVDVAKSAYAAFGRGDVPAIAALCDDKLDWQFQGGTRVAYSGRFGKVDLAHWFAEVAAHDDIQTFEPREFIAAGEHVTVLGWERAARRVPPAMSSRVPGCMSSPCETGRSCASGACTTPRRLRVDVDQERPIGTIRNPGLTFTIV
ncbi:MAG TPA: nuclear transport factor 2 family protein [Dongiaceae bacterium]|nr:nuclear transport factor 2 family protein [Dongiaceae bacterium]